MRATPPQVFVSRQPESVGQLEEARVEDGLWRLGALAHAPGAGLSGLDGVHAINFKNGSVGDDSRLGSEARLL